MRALALDLALLCAAVMVALILFAVFRLKERPGVFGPGERKSVFMPLPTSGGILTPAC